MSEIEQKDATLKVSETPKPEEVEEVLAEPEPERREYTTEEKLARVTRLKQRYEKELGIEPPVIRVETTPKERGTSSGLDDAALDYLELKGITEDEDIEVIQKVVTKTGQSLRQVLKDDYVVTKLASNKSTREAQIGTPGATRRAGQASLNDVDYWVERNARTGELPPDFETRAKLVEAKIRRFGTNEPTWRQ